MKYSRLSGKTNGEFDTKLKISTHALSLVQILDQKTARNVDYMSISCLLVNVPKNVPRNNILKLFTKLRYCLFSHIIEALFDLSVY